MYAAVSNITFTEITETASLVRQPSTAAAGGDAWFRNSSILYGADYSTNSGNTNYCWSPLTGEMFHNGGQGAQGRQPHLPYPLG